MVDINEISYVMKRIKDEAPLIHCITNPISINDCANFVLAVGGKPIMAEHPLEVEEITSRADALALNTGNITDARLESIMLSAGKADRLDIPWIIDAVGVGCSRLRLRYVNELLEKHIPSVLKGNMSEIKALYSMESSTRGIDVSLVDATTDENLDENIEIAAGLALKYNTVVLASGHKDIITDGTAVVTVENGCREMSLITGTGCILNVMTAAALSVTDSITAPVWAATALGIAGELADKSRGAATYRMDILNRVSLLRNEEVKELARIEEIEDLGI